MSLISDAPSASTLLETIAQEQTLLKTKLPEGYAFQQTLAKKLKHHYQALYLTDTKQFKNTPGETGEIAHDIKTGRELFGHPIEHIPVIGAIYSFFFKTGLNWLIFGLKEKDKAELKEKGLNSRVQWAQHSESEAHGLLEHTSRQLTALLAHHWQQWEFKKDNKKTAAIDALSRKLARLTFEQLSQSSVSLQVVAQKSLKALVHSEDFTRQIKKWSRKHLKRPIETAQEKEAFYAGLCLCPGMATDFYHTDTVRPLASDILGAHGGFSETIPTEEEYNAMFANQLEKLNGMEKRVTECVNALETQVPEQIATVSVQVQTVEKDVQGVQKTVQQMSGKIEQLEIICSQQAHFIQQLMKTNPEFFDNKQEMAQEKGTQTTTVLYAHHHKP